MRSGCTHEETQAIAINPIAHNLSDIWTIRTAATCIEAGIEFRQCMRSGCTHEETQAIAINPTAHVLGTWTAREFPTCSTPGDSIRTCLRIGCNHIGDTKIGAIVTGCVTITNETQLRDLANQVNSGNYFAGTTFVLDNDIELTSAWTPIGNATNQFRGVFNGNGKSISGLRVSLWSARTEYAGLFGYVGDGGQIKNLVVNVNSITITLRDFGISAYVGGLVGFYASTMAIENVGVNIRDSIYANCGSYNSDPANSSYSGGLIGRSENAITISNSYTTGRVIAHAGSATTRSNASVYSGGLVGYASGTISILNSYTTGNVSANYAFHNYSGGLIGFSSASSNISNSYSAGIITAPYVIGPYSAGGILGHCLTSGSSNISVYYNSQSRPIAEDLFFVGANRAVGNQTTTPGITSQTFAELRTQKSFTNWDFTNAWNINSGINNGFPYLRRVNAIVSTPTLVSHTQNSITINAVTIFPSNGRTVEHGINTTGATPTTWQDETVFNELLPGTRYYIFARLKGNNSYQPSLPLQVTTNKAPGTTVSDPTLASKTHNSVTINPSSLQTSTGQVVEYAITTLTVAPTSGWQTGLTFTGLMASTTYSIFARSRESTTHNTGSISDALITITDCDHTWNDWLETTAPTCETDGIETRYCNICGVTNAETQTGTQKLGHEMLDNWQVTIPTTFYADGEETRTCTRENCTHSETRPYTWIEFGDLEITRIQDQNYTGTQIRPTVSVRLKNDKTLLNESIVSVSYGANRNVATGGTATVTALGHTHVVNFRILPREVTITGTTAQNKPYDGTTAATMSGTTVAGIILGNDVQIDVTGTFEDKNVGTEKTVNATITLKGTDAPNYILKDPNVTLTANITRVPLTITLDPKIVTVEASQGAPDFTAYLSYNGFVGGDTPQVLDGELGITHSYISGTSPTGLYSVTLNMGTLSAANYNISLDNTNLFLNVIADRTQGATVVAPNSASNITVNSITINAVPAPANGQKVEYAINTSNTAPVSGWQESTVFSGLSANTTYYIFARSQLNTTHRAGTASSAFEVKTNYCDHNWGNWAETTTPTCETDGERTRTCTICGIKDTETQVVTKLGHTAGAAATCLTPQTCTRCSFVFVAALDHSWLDNWATTTAATCLADGVQTRICAREGCTYPQTRPIPKLTGDSCNPSSIRNNNRDRRYGIILDPAIVTDIAKISVITPEAAQINLAIFDAAGNIVHNVETHCHTSQNCTIVWDLTNANSRFVANGAYLVIVEATGISGKRYLYSARVGVNR
jgi:hypothetical protein